MKLFQLFLFVGTLAVMGCNAGDSAAPGANSAENTLGNGPGQSAVQDNVSAANIVQVAVGSADHTTLVAALKAADLVNALSNAGPFTVFAPTNAAFDKLPAGTVDGLLKPEKKADLSNILEYHVSLGVYKEESFNDGQRLGQVNGGNIIITLVDGKPVINGNANIIATVPATNGVVYVIDNVLLPQ